MGSRLRSSTRASTVASESLAETETKIKNESRPRATAAARPLKPNELARLARVGSFLLLFSLIIIGGVIYFSLNDVLRLYPSTIKEDSLRGFNSRAEFSLRYQTMLYLWLVFNIHSVIYARITRRALNPLVESTEKHAQLQKNILTNSFEQIIMSSFLQLAFASFANAGLVMRLIPAVNIVQFVGRIAFFFGYPLYRTLGFSLTMTPNLLMLCYNAYKLGSYVGLY